MNKNRRSAAIMGVLFLIAMLASLMGGGFLETILGSPAYLTNISDHTNQIWTGVFLELINCIAVVGIATMLFPFIKMHNQQMAIGYVSFRIIEAVFLTICAIIPLSILNLNQEYLQAGTANAACFKYAGNLMIAARADIAGLLAPIFFSLGALIFYTFLYQTKLLPRFISIWGFVGVVLILALNLLKLDFSIGMILALPIILNEIFLGFWLIIKGFNEEAVSG